MKFMLRQSDVISRKIQMKMKIFKNENEFVTGESNKSPCNLICNRARGAVTSLTKYTSSFTNSSIDYQL